MISMKKICVRDIKEIIANMNDNETIGSIFQTKEDDKKNTVIILNNDINELLL